MGLPHVQEYTLSFLASYCPLQRSGTIPDSQRLMTVGTGCPSLPDRDGHSQGQLRRSHAETRNKILKESCRWDMCKVGRERQTEEILYDEMEPRREVDEGHGESPKGTLAGRRDKVVHSQPSKSDTCCHTQWPFFLVHMYWL